MAVSDYKTNPDENTTISGINIAEGCPPSGINNAIRQLMADVKSDHDAQAETNESLATTIMTGATSSAAGAAGLVPAPAKGAQNRPLRGDGTWADSLDCNITGNAATATKLQGGAGNLAMPVGAIYVQFPTQQEPSAIFGGTWSNISYLYDGCFFRAEGTNAAAFGNVQGWAAPQIFGELRDVHFGTQPSSTGGLTYFWQGTYPGGSTSGATQYIYGNVQLNANAYNEGYGAADEVRPKNHTIRIWKRTE